MYFVYVLMSERTGRRYTGSTADIDDRLRRHNAGETKSTRFGVPWRVLYTEDFATRGEAMQRERKLRNGKGRDELIRLLGPVDS